MELTVDMMALTIPTMSNAATSGGSTSNAMIELAWSGDARFGNSTLVSSPIARTLRPMMNWKPMAMAIACLTVFSSRIE